MIHNYFNFTLAEMKKYCQMSKDSGGILNWVEILELNKYPYRITQIQVVDDNARSNVLAVAQWGWSAEDGELKFGKVEVKDESIKNHNIGTVIMKMVIAIAKYYKAPRITGTIAGEKFLWFWYAQLGFTIYDHNKLIMEFESLS